MVPRLRPHFPRKVPGNQTSLTGDDPIWLPPRAGGPSVLSIWGPYVAPRFLSRGRPPTRTKGSALTCGRWAGSCGRPGTRSPAVVGSWRCVGRGRRPLLRGRRSGASRSPQSSPCLREGRAHGGVRDRRSAAKTARLPGWEWRQRKGVVGRTG